MNIMNGKIRLKMKKNQTRSKAMNLMLNTVLVLGAAFMALPLVYALISAFKPFEEIFIFPPRFLVRRPTMDNFIGLFAMSSKLWVPFSRYIFNSIFVTLTATVLHVIFASAAAYPISKHVFPGKAIIQKIIVAALLFTGYVTFIPQYIVMAKLGLINTYAALILPSIGSALGLFLMIQFMQGIPAVMLEAARIDGASEYKTFWMIVMPTVKPAWLTLAIFAFQVIWNNPPMQFIYDEQLKLLPTALNQIASAGISRFGAGMAASVLLLLPPIIIFTLIQGKVIETMAHAGIKG